MPRIFVVFNPASGRGDPTQNRRRILEQLQRANCEFVMYDTKCPGDARRAAEEAQRSGYEIVAAAGGDGTVMETASGVVGTHSALGIIPLGTANLLSLELGIPRGIEKACQLLWCSHGMVELDVGAIGDKYFAIMAGAGFDAQVIQAATRRLKKRLGLASYVLAAIRETFRLKSAHFNINADGKAVQAEGLTVLIANVGSFAAGIVRLGPSISTYDGKLDVVVLAPTNFFSVLAVIYRVLFRHYTSSAHFRHLQGQNIEVYSDPQVLVQMDGEVVGHTPFKVTAVQGGLKVIVPVQTEKHLEKILQKPIPTIS